MLSKLRVERENEEGFTLIELLVVVIIIGILAAIAIPAFLNQRERAWQSELTSTVRNVALDVESEATKYGGDYSQVTNGTDFDGFVSDSLEDIQDAAATPVSYEAGAASTTSFTICMEHVQLQGDSIGSVTYSASAGGIQPFSNAACPATVSP